MPMSTCLCVRWAAEQFGTRTEMKNLNSFKAIARAIEGRACPPDRADRGGQGRSSRRRAAGMTIRNIPMPMRSKEDAQDYRYFPDPDLVPVIISDEWLQASQTDRQPELRDREAVHAIKRNSISRIMMRRLLTEFQASGRSVRGDNAELCGKPKKVSNWLMGETLRLLKEAGAGAGGYHLLGRTSGKADRVARRRHDQPVPSPRRSSSRSSVRILIRSSTSKCMA